MTPQLLYRLIGVNVRILRINVTLLCWCGVSNVLFIFPDMEIKAVSKIFEMVITFVLVIRK